MRIMASSIGFATLVIASLACSPSVLAQDPWKPFDTQTKASLRGLAAVSKEIAWACGSKGTVVQTLDGGKTWQRLSLPNLQETEIRSIHSWDGDKAIVATAGQPALILKTIDRGVTWKTTYENKSPQAFFDGMRFWNSSSGIAFSDPVDGGLLIVTTKDGGDSWQPIDPKAIPEIDLGEAGFAASNSSLHTFDSQLAWIGLGGGSVGPSRIFQTKDGGKTWSAHLVPSIVRGTSSGIFSIAFENELHGVAVGGDYNKTTSDAGNIAVTTDGGLNWRVSQTNRPRGFRSAVVAVRSVGSGSSKTSWVACGPSGCEKSTDGEKWDSLSDVGFHTLSVASDGTVWAAGSEGRAARLSEYE